MVTSESKPQNLFFDLSGRFSAPPPALTESQANNVIMAARASWFPEEDASQAASA